MSDAEKAVQKVRDYLESVGCDSRIIHSERTIFTVDDAARAAGAPPEKILKSLLFTVDDGERWVLALMSGANRVNDKQVRREVGAKKIRMGSAAAIFEYSGFEPGGVPPVGYLQQPETLLDEDLFLYDVLWGAAGSDHDFFSIAPTELKRITGGRIAAIKK